MMLMAMQYLHNVATVRIDSEKCIGCGLCVEVCPHNVLRVENGKALVGERDDCMECGACAMNCPCEAVKVESGTGCAAAVLLGFLKGTAPDCSCGEGSGCP